MSDHRDGSFERDHGSLQRFAANAVELLATEDPELMALIEAEYARQSGSLAMVASCSTAHPSVLACEGTFTSNVTAEGFPSTFSHIRQAPLIR